MVLINIALMSKKAEQLFIYLLNMSIFFSKMSVQNVQTWETLEHSAQNGMSVLNPSLIGSGIHVEEEKEKL